MNKIKIGFLLILSCFVAQGAYAASMGFTNGPISVVSVQPDGGTVVTMTGATGPCGSEFFFLPGDQANVKSLYAMFLTAYALQQNVSAGTESCSGTTNVIDTAFMLQ